MIPQLNADTHLITSDLTIKKHKGLGGEKSPPGKGTKMLESRKSYGWGCAGTNKKGYEWHFQPDEKDPCYRKGYRHIGVVQSGYVYPTEKKAIQEGKKWLKETKGKRSGAITAVKAEPEHFEY